MRFLFLFLFSFSLQAGYSPACQEGIKGFYRDKAVCEHKSGVTCLWVTRGVNCEYDKIVNAIVDDHTKPITIEVECPESIAVNITATVSTELSPTVPTELTTTAPEEICHKITGYEKMETNRKIVVHDVEKKAAHDELKAFRKSIKETMGKGRDKRAKCKAMLEFITGANTGLDIISVDAMIYKFKDIYEALDKPCRLPKAIAEIRKVVDPEYQGMRQALLIIAEGK